MDPRAIFCSVTCHKGPMAGLAQKMNPGPFAGDLHGSRLRGQVRHPCRQVTTFFKVRERSVWGRQGPGGDWSGFRFFLAGGDAPSGVQHKGGQVAPSRGVQRRPWTAASARPRDVLHRQSRPSPFVVSHRRFRQVHEHAGKAHQKTASPRGSCRGRCRGRWCWRGTRSRRFPRPPACRRCRAAPAQCTRRWISMPCSRWPVPSSLGRRLRRHVDALAGAGVAATAGKTACLLLRPTPAGRGDLCRCPASHRVGDLSHRRAHAQLSQVNTPWSCISFKSRRGPRA